MSAQTTSLPAKPENPTLAVAFREKSLCTRSGTCLGVCPEAAITLDDNYYPVLDESRCTQCGRCGEVCPGEAIDFNTLSQITFQADDDLSFDGHIESNYIGHASDPHIHQFGTGGGITTALALDMLENGTPDGRAVDGIVATRMRTDKPWLGEPFIAESQTALMQSQGSRYTVIPLNQILVTLLAPENNGKRFVIAALPCHIHGLRKALETVPLLQERVAALLGTYCGGAFEPVVVPELLQTKRIPLDEISNFEFRGGEWPGQMRAIFDDRPPQPVHYSNYKDGAYNYLIGIYLPQRCQMCYDGSNLFADIAVGDAWTKDEQGDYKYHAQSRVLARTSHGQAIIQAALKRNAIKLQDVSNDPSYRTHKMRTQRKGITAPLRVARLSAKGVPVPRYDRPTPASSAKERLAERLVSAFLWTGRYRILRYSITKLLTSRAMIPLIKLRLWRKKRKYQKRSLERS